MTCGGSAPRDYVAKVVGSRTLGPGQSRQELDDGFGLLAVECGEIAAASEAGQFVMVRPGSYGDPFLGRPLAVASASGGIFKIVYRVVGRGTALLASKRQGDSLVVRGPIGRGFFTAREGVPLPKKVYLAGGSVGAAPLLFAARALGMSKLAGVSMGVSGKRWEGFAEWLKESFPGVALYSDDGTVGTKGTALDGLPVELPADSEIWACGPEGMLKALAARYPADGTRIRVAMEGRMACGMGGCLGCVVPTVSGNKRVCVDGPVFKAEEVLWNELTR